MIYGINFNGQPIPDGIKRKFAREIRIRPKVRAVLAGVGQSQTERDVMLVTASNGHRKLHVVERSTAAGTWYGVYVYYE